MCFKVALTKENLGFVSYLATAGGQLWFQIKKKKSVTAKLYGFFPQLPAEVKGQEPSADRELLFAK